MDKVLLGRFYKREEQIHKLRLIRCFGRPHQLNLFKPNMEVDPFLSLSHFSVSVCYIEKTEVKKY